jgi:hypothetical protein
MKIDADFEDAKNALRHLSDVEIAISIRYILNTIATAGKNWVKRRMIGITQRTGWLKKHVYGYRRSNTHLVIAAPRHVSETLERGAVIKHRRITYKRHHLHFKGPDGRWTKAKTVTIPAKRWFTRSIEGFDGSAEYKAAIDKGLDKAMKKFNGE